MNSSVESVENALLISTKFIDVCRIYSMIDLPAINVYIPSLGEIVDLNEYCRVRMEGVLMYRVRAGYEWIAYQWLEELFVVFDYINTVVSPKLIIR